MCFIQSLVFYHSLSWTLRSHCRVIICPHFDTVVSGDRVAEERGRDGKQLVDGAVRTHDTENVCHPVQGQCVESQNNHSEYHWPRISKRYIIIMNSFKHCGNQQNRTETWSGQNVGKCVCRLAGLGVATKLQSVQKTVSVKQRATRGGAPACGDVGTGARVWARVYTLLAGAFESK